MNLGRVVTITFLYLIVVYLIIPSIPKYESFFVDNKYEYLLPDNNGQMFKNINLKSSQHAASSHGLVNGLGFNEAAPRTLSTNSYSYNSCMSTINSEIQSVNSFQMTASDLQLNSNKSRQNNIYSTNDFSAIGDLRILAEVFDRGKHVSTSDFGQPDNNFAIGLQNTNNSIFNAPAENPGDNPEGDPLPLGDDCQIYFVLMAIYVVLKRLSKTTCFCVKQKNRKIVSNQFS